MLLQPMSSPQMTRMLGLPAVASAEAGFLPAAPELGVGESAASAVAAPTNAAHVMTYVAYAHIYLYRFALIFPALVGYSRIRRPRSKRAQPAFQYQMAISLWLLARVRRVLDLRDDLIEVPALRRLKRRELLVA